MTFLFLFTLQWQLTKFMNGKQTLKLQNNLKGHETFVIRQD